MTKPRHGPLLAGEPVQLTDPKGRSHIITLRAGASFHTHRGMVSHDDIIGGPDGNVVRSGGGTPYVVFRPLLADYTLTMKRGAAVVYPKDAAQIVTFADVFPGARVLEAEPAPVRCPAGCCGPLASRAPSSRSSAGPTSRRSPSATSSSSSAGCRRPGSWSSASSATRPTINRWPTSTGSCWTCSRRGSAWTRWPRSWPPAAWSAATWPPRPSFPCRGGAARARRLR